MSAGRELEAQAAALRSAVIEGRYREAERLLPEYAKAVAEFRNCEAVAEACRLMEWARRLALGRKAAAAARAAALPPSLCRYAGTRDPGGHSWEVVG